MKPNEVAAVGIMIGDPARASMLIELMGGRALTATELARCANVTPQTASSHLAKMVAASLLKVEKQGRHRYHRIASVETARLLENVMQIATGTERSGAPVVTGPRDTAMRKARTCYDHIAGRLGIAITDSLLASGHIEFADEAGLITQGGIDHLSSFGILLADPFATKRKSKRPLCRPCLDWSERRPHLAGEVGAQICSYFLRERLILRVDGTRALHITPKGLDRLREVFGIRRLD